MRLSIPQYAEALLDLESEIASDRAALTAENFVSWLARRGESGKLSSIVRQAERLIADRSGVVDVDIISAHQREAEAEMLLIDQAAKIFPGKKVRARFSTNPDLIGGSQFRSEETLYDGSIAGTMKKLRSSLVQ